MDMPATRDLSDLHVGYLVSQYPARSHTFIRREIEGLRARGARIDVFTIRLPALAELLDDKDREEYRTTEAILPASFAKVLRSQIEALQEPSRYRTAFNAALAHRLPGARNALWSAFYFAEGAALAQRLKRRGVRHLHVHFANSGAYVGRIAARLAGIRWSMTLHGASDFEYPNGPLLPEKVLDAAFTVCISQYGASQVMRMLDPAEWHRLIVSRCAIDWSRLPTPTPRSHGSDETRVICVGRLSAEKGQLGLVEAFAKAHAEDARLRLTLVGDGPTRARVSARIAELGVGHLVEMTGALPEAETLKRIADSDMLVLASFMEGIPLVLIEAMSLRVPVIAPRVAGIPELVEDFQTGLMFHPGDWSDLAKKLCGLASDTSLRAHLIENGQQKVRAEFSHPRALDPLARALLHVHPST
jgi:colanic acid/amylovoran biosynthesis glycosyltransferase